LYKIFKSVSVHGTPVVIPAPTLCVFDMTDDDEVDSVELFCESIEPEPDLPPEQTIEQLLEAAQLQADSIIAAAQEQIEAQRATATDEGFRQGYQNGLEQVRQAIDNATDRAQEITTLGEQQAAQALLSAEQQMVEIAMAVARKIIIQEIAQSPETVLPIVRAALEKVRDQDQVTIRVSSADLAIVRQAKSDLQSTLDRDSVITISSEDFLNNGDCVIDTAFGAVDASIDSQLESIGAALREASNG